MTFGGPFPGRTVLSDAHTNSARRTPSSRAAGAEPAAKACTADRTRRAFRRVRWLAAGLALPSALALAALSSADDSNQASAAAPPPSSTSSLLTTPLLSPARLP